MEHIIWSNFDINVADYADFLKENYPEVTDPNEQYELCCEMNYAYLDDEKANIDIELPNPIICIADLGRWNGRSMGYKMIESGNIADCLWDGGVIIVRGMLIATMTCVSLEHTMTARTAISIESCVTSPTSRWRTSLRSCTQAD